MWQLIFEDQFPSDSSLSATGPWITGYGFPGAQTHGNEPQYYTRYDKNFTTNCPNKGGLNHSFSGSDMTLLLKWEPGNYETFNWDSAGNLFKACLHFNYTSGMIFSKARYLYGKFEIRCKIPANGRLFWPAFWLWGQDSLTTYREIDVFEFVDPSKTTLITTLHLSRTDDNNFTKPDSQWGNPPINVFKHTTDLTANVGDYHIYAVVWTPNSVTWFFDGNPVNSLGEGHVPHRDAAIIANLAIAPWLPLPAQSQLPAGMQIDYIRVYRSDAREFLFQTGNPGDNRLGLWILHVGDQYISADVDGDGTSEVLLAALNGWSVLTRWSGGTWPSLWDNCGSHKIVGWVLSAGDQFIPGDFDGDGKAEILNIGLSGWSALMKWTGQGWGGLWDNGGSHKIVGWVLSAGDQFIPGDFDGDGKAEILVVSLSGWAALLQWTGLAWSSVWDNQGAKTIHIWFMNSSDRFFPLKNSGGPQTLAAISMGGWWQTLKFDPLP